MEFVFSLLRRHVVKTTDAGATETDLRESKFGERNEHVANDNE